MDCPQRAKLVAFIRSDDEAPREEAKLGTLHLLSAIKAKEDQRLRGSMFVEAEVGGKSLKALVDTGASHIFMAEDVVKKIGLSFAKKAGFIKAVNSKEMSILGMAEATEMRIGQ